MQMVRTTVLIFLLFGTGCADLTRRAHFNYFAHGRRAYDGPQRKWNETAVLSHGFGVHNPSAEAIHGVGVHDLRAGKEGSVRVSVRFDTVDGTKVKSLPGRGQGATAGSVVEVLPGYHTVTFHWNREVFHESELVDLADEIVGRTGLSTTGWKPKDGGEISVPVLAEAGQLYITEITDVEGTRPRIKFRSQPRPPPPDS
jgi:hypothetical protein